MQQRKLPQRRRRGQKKHFDGDFPAGVLETILVKLPIKSLMKFKVVCKSWRKILDSSYFVRMQIDHAKNRQKLLIYSMDRGTRVSQIDMVCKRNNSFVFNRIFAPFYTAPFDGRVIEDSCNGLVSCKPISSASRVYLWNPATRETKFVQLPYMDTNPSVGIVFVAETNDYKMVRIPNNYNLGGNLVSNSNEKKTSVWVYSLNSDSWKELKFDSRYGPLVSGNAISLHGCMHWLVYEAGGGGQIAVFDLKNEILKYFPIMVHIDGNLAVHKRALGVIKGTLSIVMLLRNNELELFYEVWQMNEYGVGRSWMKMPIIHKFLLMPYPLGFYNDEIIFFHNWHDRNKVFFYDYQTGIKKSLRLDLYEDAFALNYIETLVSLRTRDI